MELLRWQSDNEAGDDFDDASERRCAAITAATLCVDPSVRSVSGDDGGPADTKEEHSRRSSRERSGANGEGGKDAEGGTAQLEAEKAVAVEREEREEREGGREEEGKESLGVGFGAERSTSGLR